MANSVFNRRHFNQATLVSVLAATASTAVTGTTSAQQASDVPTRRDVIRQEIPGEPPRDLSLVEITYPPEMGSPPHLHANGVMVFVVSGAIVSKVGEEAEQTFHAGDAWWEPPGAIHRISRNGSSTEPATLLAIYVAPKGATADDLMKPI
jgi:quercetin dioxygenase-like cupin family protein